MDENLKTSKFWKNLFLVLVVGLFAVSIALAARYKRVFNYPHQPQVERKAPIKKPQIGKVYRKHHNNAKRSTCQCDTIVIVLQ